MKNVIIVEDDPGISEIMTIILETAGYSVTSFYDGTLVLRNAYKVPQLFIIDKQLHGIDGLDICWHLKNQEETKLVPVMMVSANPDIIELAKDARADDALEKPFNMKELTDKVDALIGV